MNSLLTPEDSKRVADVLVEKIEDADFDVASMVGDYLEEFLQPTSSPAGWKKDWFQLAVCQMLDEIGRRGMRR